MKILTFVWLLVFHLVISYLLLFQYENYDYFKESKGSDVYYTNFYYACSLLTFLLLLCNGVMFICDIRLDKYRKIFAYTGLLVCVINCTVYIPLCRAEYETLRTIHKRPSNSECKSIEPLEKVINYTENAIILGGLLFVASTSLLIH